MFYSKCLISRKGPLGTIWVAAFCFNKLKRSQVNGTDIFFSVDKILRDEINEQTYGVLANLLLGLVRIYSRKVEYLFDDCSEMFFKIKKFVITTTKINVAPRAENLCTSITLPPTFALDAFDLIIPEDDGDQRNIAPLEEITLEDDSWENYQTGQFSLVEYQSDRFEWFQGTFSPEEALVEQPRDVHQSHLMDIDLEITELITPMNEDFQDCTFSPEEQMQLDTDANHKERDLQMIMASIQEGQSYQEESTENDNTYVEEDMLEAHSTEGTNEESQNQNQNQNQNLQEGVYIEGGRAFVPVESIFIDLTSLPHVASIPRPNPGDTTPEFMVIPTPAPTEGASLSRRRKLVYDDSTKLPDEVFKESVNDASDLIREWKRPITPLQASQASRISSLSKGFFYEPLLPFQSLELRSLFSRKKMRIPASVEPLETSGNSNEAESQATNSLDLTETAPNTALQLSEIQSVDSPDNVTSSSPYESILDIDQTLGNDELNLTNEPNVGALSLYEALEGEHSLSKDESFNLMNEDSNATETENSESCGAWTGQTRKVAKQLQKSFMNQRKQKEEEVVSFSQVCGEKPRKECARLFYEMLVMKTTNFVDLEQNDAYGDISVKKLPKLDQIL